MNISNNTNSAHTTVPKSSPDFLTYLMKETTSTSDTIHKPRSPLESATDYDEDGLQSGYSALLLYVPPHPQKPGTTLNLKITVAHLFACPPIMGSRACEEAPDGGSLM